MLSVQRHELKYYIHSRDADLLSRRLSQILTVDPNETCADGYRIKSLYFDTSGAGALYDKQAGFHNRRKYRLRIYSEDDQTAKLEIKFKSNQQIRKVSLGINRQQAEQLVLGDFSSLGLESEQAKVFYSRLITGGYRPMVIVEYWRKAFIYPAYNIRITLDRYLHGDTSSLNLFAKAGSAFPVMMPGRQVLEVKFDQYLPGFIRRMIEGIALERAAISKYTLARRHYKLNQWEDQ